MTNYYKTVQMNNILQHSYHTTYERDFESIHKQKISLCYGEIIKTDIDCINSKVSSSVIQRIL